MSSNDASVPVGGMDILRPRRRRRWPFVVAIALAAAAVAAVVVRFDRAAPSVDRGDLFIGTVERGALVREVRATGVLAPEQVHWVTATAPARVDRVSAVPGAQVTAETELAVMSNPDIELQALEAERELAGAESKLAEMDTQFQDDALARKLLVTSIDLDLTRSREKTANASTLAVNGIIAREEERDLALATRSLEVRLGLERQRLRQVKVGRKQRLTAQDREIERLRSTVEFRRQMVASLHARAGIAGIVQELPVEPGQWVTVGALIAKVADPSRLKAVLRVPEAQAKDVRVGQKVRVDLHDATVAGAVRRVDPAVRDGAVTVEVALEGELPAGARPDLSVEGTIEIERLDDVLFVGRPAGGAGVTELFKLDGDDEAVRVPVTLGRDSARAVEVTAGLRAGDRVILSDTSAWAGARRLRLE